LVDIGSLFIAHAQATKLVKPCKGPLDYPTVPTQATAMFSVSFRELRANSPQPETSPVCFGVITTVGNYTVGAMAWPASFAL
jgi:hypothetical protein